MGSRKNGVPREVTQQREMTAWELRQLGWTQQRIANEMGVAQGTVSKALTRLGTKYNQETMKNVAAVKGEQIAQLEAIRDMAMQEWLNSRSEYKEVSVRYQRVTEEHIDPDTLEDWEPPDEEEDSEKRLQIMTIIRRQRLGDPRYLKIAMEASAEIRKIMGIDSSNRLYAVLFEKVDWESITLPQIKRLESGEDPLAVLLGA